MPKREIKEKNDTPSNKRTKAVEIPACLQELQSKFEAVNIYCSFCDARLTSSVTLESLQKAVPSLTCEDLAAMNVILPNFVKFNSVSTETLQVEFGTPVSKKSSKDKHGQALRNRGDDWFIDNNKNQAVIKPDLIKKSIGQQNKLFKDAIPNFLKTCQEKNVDPKVYLLEQQERYMPCPFFVDDSDLFQDQPLAQIKSISQIIDGLKSQVFYDGQLDKPENILTFPARPALYGNYEQLSPQINLALKEKGIHQLYLHQTEALKGLLNDQHVIVSTSTASGKSLIYQIPVLETLLKNKCAKAMYIFPTKALAQDQKRALETIMHQIPHLEHVMISTFDGDTPTEQRAFIKSNATIIFTNPDMLHHAILPHAKSWSLFLSQLSHVVVDELHVYNGLFGTHVALIMRRLTRLCRYYNNENIKFISCSATIEHPDKHMQTLFGVDNVKLVSQDGAPHGQKKCVVWNPPLLYPTKPERNDATMETARLFQYLIENNVRTIVFCKVRKTCELLMKQVRENLCQKPTLLQRVMSYRGGYTPHDRREIESQMFEGKLSGIIATNALELGIDIGALDAVLMVGVPWSISALWQQSGRAGRRNEDSLTLVVCDNNPLDQYYANHPSVLFEKTPDILSIDLENSIVLESHIQCAAEELPIDTDKDEMYFGPNLDKICRDHLAKIDDHLYRPNKQFRPYPSKFVNIRNIQRDTFAVVYHQNILEEIEVHRAAFEIYEGAIFIHQGRTYLVEECNTDKRYAKVHLANVDWTTVQRDYTDVDAQSTDETRHIFDSKNFVCFGQVKVTTVVFGYYRLDKKKRIMDAHDVYMDPIITHATGLWVDAPGTSVAKLQALDIDLMAAIHAASHCLISLLPRFSISSDTIRTECKNPHATRPRPTRVALYETLPSGVIKQAYRHFEQLIETCIQQIRDCVCEEGCPLCVHLAKCSEHNQVCSKQGALIVLTAMRGDRF
ncbi:hypothetical protein INT47_010496 [Mucor saturninus]|uniref:Uncharacterized protein n=1 Tax=Mucor saturninus TaxID=64648 RepID=A0A8H7VBB4_9FUNG|nr:hypothetical protein INT47_010496 [Mucor saturninus]